MVYIHVYHLNSFPGFVQMGGIAQGVFQGSNQKCGVFPHSSGGGGGSTFFKMHYQIVRWVGFEKNWKKISTAKIFMHEAYKN